MVQTNYTLAKLCRPKKGSDWYVYYRFRNPDTGKMQLFKEREGINRLRTISEKLQYGAAIVQATNELLKSGFSPFVIDPKTKLQTSSLLNVFDEMLKVKKGSIRPRSYQHYVFAIRLFKEYLTKRNITEIPADGFTPVMAQGYSDHLITDKEYSGKSHNNQIANMKVMFNMMVDREVVSKNPFLKIKKKPQDEGKLLAYSPGQKKKIVEYLSRNNHPMYLFVQFLYYCFIRPNELMSLQVKHIDFDNGTILIPGSVSKNRKNGLVPIKDSFLSELKERYKSLDEESYLFGLGLLPNTKPVHRNRASQSHKLVLKDLGISSNHKLYDWKNTGARDYILAGNNPYSLMAMMRHHSLDQTMTYMRSLGLTVGMKTDPKAWNFK